MFIQVALTFIFRRKQVQTMVLRPAWLMTYAVCLGFLHTNIITALQIRPKPLTATCFWIHYLPFILTFNAILELTAWPIKDKINLSLPTPWRQTGRVEVQLHSFLTSALQGSKPRTHALAHLSSVTMLYELQNSECYIRTLRLIIKAAYDQEFPMAHLTNVQCWLQHLL